MLQFEAVLSAAVGEGLEVLSVVTLALDALYFAVQILIAAATDSIGAVDSLQLGRPVSDRSADLADVHNCHR